MTRTNRWVLQVRLCRRILRALASNSQPQQQEREAVTLLRASLDPATLLTTSSSLHDYEACLDTVLFHSHRLLPATVTTLLGCFSLPVYASKLLEEEGGRRSSGAGEGSSGWAREESARVSGWRPDGSSCVARRRRPCAG